nr:RING/FYVE/PHD zinc finger superfamily protein [Ipomoea batatas]
MQFMLLLILRHTLPIIIYGAGDYSITLFTLLVLRAIGILLPIYVMVKAFTVIRRRRNTEVSLVGQFLSLFSEQVQLIPCVRLLNTIQLLCLYGFICLFCIC